jgi:hypothetical protein
MPNGMDVLSLGIIYKVPLVKRPKPRGEKTFLQAVSDF